jgi:hypothetical protein|tara:strand:+ start:1383 stop:2753 length:1371 start_codon:yes stop_codon:yes gene_type:complete
MTSTIKVNKIEKESGSTLTLGGPGTAVTLACGATQTGFGRSGSVNWCTTAKTSPFTAANGEGYFVNTTGGVVTVTLPSSPSAGDVVALKDYANTFDSNAVTIGRGGSKIGGLCLDATLSTEGQTVTLVYVDGTEGWINVQTDSNVSGALYVEATGGTVITSGDYKTHVFTGDGTFQITNAGQPSGSTTYDYFVVAGGGGSGNDLGGGGGAGGFRISNSTAGGIPAPSMSPLVTTTALTAAISSISVTVGGGGAAGTSGDGGSGSNSILSSITSAGGGGAPNSGSPAVGVAGGSGSGAGGCASGNTGGAGNTPPVSPPQGNNGGNSAGGGSSEAGGGGGGAGAVGTNGVSSTSAGNGGDGSFISDTFFGPTAPSYGTPGPTSSTRYFSGGGGGGGATNVGPKSTGGAGGGGIGDSPSNPGNTAGTTNTGGGAGGARGSGAGLAGGSGFVAVRYKFQN